MKELPLITYVGPELIFQKVKERTHNPLNIKWGRKQIKTNK